MSQIDSHLPLVSVIVPAYNADKFIGETLNSALSQTYSNIEILVVDDGSQDRTSEVVKAFVQKDERVILLQQANAGVAAARNLAIEKSRGEYIAPLDADDIWYPQKLEKQMQCFLEADESVGLVYAWSASIDEEGKIFWRSKTVNLDQINYVEGYVFTALVYSNFISNASVPLIRRACLERVGGYNCQLKAQNAQGCEDWDLSLRIAELYQFRVVPEFLIGYRQVIGSMGSNCGTMERSYELVMAQVKQKHPEISDDIYRWAKSNFYNYLIGKSSVCSDYYNVLIYLIKLLRVDPAVVLRASLYRLFIRSIINLAFKKATPLIHFWLKFIQRASYNEQAWTISALNMAIKCSQPVTWRPYDKITWQRTFKVVNQIGKIVI